MLHVHVNGADLYRGDCKKLLKRIGPVDAIVTDPPFGIDAPNMTMGTGKKEFHRGDWDKERPDIQPLLKAAPVLILWGGNYFVDQLPVTNDWMIWHKKNDGLSYSEFEMAWSNSGKNSRLLSHHWSGEVKHHPTQKPLAVIRWCLKVLGLPKGSRILDPYMGSGTTIVACIQAGYKGIGIEVDKTYFEVARQRVANAKYLPTIADLKTKAPKQKGLFGNGLS